MARVGHPRDPDSATILGGNAGPRLRRIEVAAVINPAHRAHRRTIVRHKAFAVETANEILHRRSRRESRLSRHPDAQDPTRATALHGQFEQVRCFPRPACEATRPERTDFAPRSQIFRRINRYALVTRVHQHHNPTLAGLVPKHLWITKLTSAGPLNDRIAVILNPSASAIETVGEILALALIPRVMARIERDHRRRTMVRKSGAIGCVDYGASREDHDVALRHRHAEIAPIHQIAADGMAPAQMPPTIAAWVVLVEEMVLAVVEDEPVWIVHPICRRREMICWPKTLFVARRGRAARRAQYS